MIDVNIKSEFFNNLIALLDSNGFVQHGFNLTNETTISFKCCKQFVLFYYLLAVSGAPTTFMSWSEKTFAISSFVGGEVHLSVTLKNASIFPAGI